MELCAGGDLDKHMRAKQGGPYTERQAGHGPTGGSSRVGPGGSPTERLGDQGRDPHGADLDICSWAAVEKYSCDSSLV